jgi:hypothetical protein
MREFPRISERGNDALTIFRERWAGKWPRDGIGWLELDSHKAEVMRAAFGDAESKRLLAAGDRDMLETRRAFIAALTEGEPAARMVDPIIVPGNVAGIGPTDWNGFRESAAAQLDGIGGDDD